jgi:hypothetical protein
LVLHEIYSVNLKKRKLLKSTENDMTGNQGFRSSLYICLGNTVAGKKDRPGKQIFSDLLSGLLVTVPSPGTFVN